MSRSIVHPLSYADESLTRARHIAKSVLENKLDDRYKLNRKLASGLLMFVDGSKGWTPFPREMKFCAMIRVPL